MASSRKPASAPRGRVFAFKSRHPGRELFDRPGVINDQFCECFQAALKVTSRHLTWRAKEELGWVAQGASEPYSAFSGRRMFASFPSHHRPTADADLLREVILS